MAGDGPQKRQKDLDSKFGNFNTPIVMKLCSKYNKGIQSTRMKADPSQICEKVVSNLNEMLAQGDLSNRWPLITSEVQTFTSLNGFINVFLVHPESQLADRIQLTLKKR
jgi:pyruvate/oxaloacetate carboxyltransferase